MTRMTATLGEMMAELMVDTESDVGGALASNLSRLFDSLHTLSVTFLLPPGGVFARFSNFAEKGGRIRLSFHTALLDQADSINLHADLDDASERENLPTKSSVVVLIPWEEPQGLPVDCIRRRGVMTFEWPPGTKWRQRYLRRARNLALSLSDALAPRASKVVRDTLILAPPLFTPWSPMSSCGCELAVTAAPDWQDMVDWDMMFVASLAEYLQAVSGGTGGVCGPEEAGPCIQRDATGMGSPEIDRAAKPFAEFDSAGGSKTTGAGANSMSLTSSEEVQPPDREGSSSGIGRPPGGLLPPHGHSLTFQAAVAEAKFGVDFAQHRYVTDGMAVFFLLVGRWILSGNLSVNLQRFSWGRVELGCLSTVLIIMLLQQHLYLQFRDWFVAGVTICFRVSDLWYLKELVRGCYPTILWQWMLLVPFTHAIASFFYVPRYRMGLVTCIITTLLYPAGMWDAFDAAHSLLEGWSGRSRFALLTVLACGLAIASFATAAVNITSLRYTRANEAAEREKFVAEFHVATPAMDPPLVRGRRRAPLGSIMERTRRPLAKVKCSPCFTMTGILSSR